MVRDKLTEICTRPGDENYKTLLREMTEDLNKRRGQPYSKILKHSI